MPSNHPGDRPSEAPITLERARETLEGLRAPFEAFAAELTSLNPEELHALRLEPRMYGSLRVSANDPTNLTPEFFIREGTDILSLRRGNAVLNHRMTVGFRERGTFLELLALGTRMTDAGLEADRGLRHAEILDEEMPAYDDQGARLLRAIGEKSPFPDETDRDRVVTDIVPYSEVLPKLERIAELLRRGTALLHESTERLRREAKAAALEEHFDGGQTV